MTKLIDWNKKKIYEKQIVRIFFVLLLLIFYVDSFACMYVDVWVWMYLSYNNVDVFPPYASFRSLQPNSSIFFFMYKYKFLQIFHNVAPPIPTISSFLSTPNLNILPCYF